MPKKQFLKCYFGCVVDGPLHSFPSWEYPHTERFNKWKAVLSLETKERGNKYIYDTVRLCYRHFENYFQSTQSSRLTKNAFPSLHLANVLQKEQEILPGPSSLGIDQPSTSKCQEQSEPKFEILETDPTPTSSKEQSGLQNAAANVGHTRKKLKRDYSVDTRKHIAVVNKLKQKIISLKNKCKTQKKQIQAALKISKSKSFMTTLEKLPNDIKIFTKMQLKYSKKPKGRRFTNYEKIMALTILKQGPRVYKLLKKMFVLPSIRCLQNLLNLITFRPGLNENIINNLKNIVNKMPEEKRLVNLLFDEVSLAPGLQYNAAWDEIIGFENLGNNIKNKRLADHALVLMIKGIKGKTKQPICYTFCQSATKKYDLKKLLIETIVQLRKIGFKVIATICDQSSTNVAVIRSLQEDTRLKYLKDGKEFNSKSFEIDNIKVYPLFDTPHLLKGVRNNLLTKNAKFYQNGKLKIAKWSHLELLLEADKGEDEIRLINKLTENHVHKDKIPKMKVKFAAQVFSQRVSSAMRFLAKHNILPAECQDTADFLLIFDKLFDSFNGHSYRYDSKMYKNCLKNNSVHFKLWNDLLPILESIKFESVEIRNGNRVIKHESIPSIKNWIHNIKCFKEMWVDLNQNYGMQNLLTRNFNQDPLENFFSNVRSNGFRNVNPNCNQFINAFKTLIINNFNSPHSPGANCESDNNHALQSLENLLGGGNANNDVPDFDCEVDSLLNLLIEVKSSESIVHVESKKYVTGYVVKKIKSKIFKSCQICNNDLCKSELDVDSFISEVDYTKRSLVYPSDSMCRLMNDVFCSIVACLRDFPESNYIRNKIGFFINIACDFSIITCEKHKDDLIASIKRITINLILHSWLTGVNRILSGKFLYFDERDIVKKQAQEYYAKHKKKKQNK